MDDLNTKFSFYTFWYVYSKLQTTISITRGTDITCHQKLKPFIKRTLKDTYLKSNLFSWKFVISALDNTHLFLKTFSIYAIYCLEEELWITII